MSEDGSLTVEDIQGPWDLLLVGRVGSHAYGRATYATDEDFEKMWTLRRGEHIIFTMPKKVVIRSMAYNHLVHHRGQLSVYLRLLDVPVPGMYGPSFDEKPAAEPVVESALG